jgi:hypothetical protein
METPPTTKARISGKMVLHYGGWAAFVLSGWFALLSKGADRESLAPYGFLCSMGILALGSVVYCVGTLVSQKWRSKTVRSCFAPYLLGTGGLVMLIVLLWLLQFV